MDKRTGGVLVSIEEVSYINRCDVKFGEATPGEGLDGARQDRWFKLDCVGPKERSFRRC